MGRIAGPFLRLLSSVCLSDYWSQAKERNESLSSIVCFYFHSHLILLARVIFFFFFFFSVLRIGTLSTTPLLYFHCLLCGSVLKSKRTSFVRSCICLIWFAINTFVSNMQQTQRDIKVLQRDQNYVHYVTQRAEFNSFCATLSIVANWLTCLHSCWCFWQHICILLNVWHSGVYVSQRLYKGYETIQWDQHRQCRVVS